MPPGIYRADVIVRDVLREIKVSSSLGFKVPKYDPGHFRHRLLFWRRHCDRPMTRDLADRFVVGNTKLIPNLSGVYKQGQPVGVYMQVYNAGIDQTTLRPAWMSTIVVLKDGKEVSSTKEDWSGLSDSSQRLTLRDLLPTENLKPGKYEVKIMVKDQVSEQEIENSARFTILNKH